MSTPLLDRLNQSQMDYYRAARSSDRPALILVHPKTFDDLLDEAMSILDNPSDMTNPKFRGVSIYRSFDMKLNTFITR